MKREEDLTLEGFEEFIRNIKYWKPTCQPVEWKDIEKIQILEREDNSNSDEMIKLVKIPQQTEILALIFSEKISLEERDQLERKKQEISFLLSSKHPNIIDKLILWSTTSKIEWNSLKIIKERIDLAKQNKIEELNKIMAKEIYCEKTLKEYWEAILEANSEVNEDEINKFIKLAASMINFNTDDKLDNIKCKTFVIGSNNDEIFWSGPSNNIAKKLNCKLYLYDDYGHWVYDEAPDYRKRILEFLNEE